MTNLRFNTQIALFYWTRQALSLSLSFSRGATKSIKNIHSMLASFEDGLPSSLLQNDSSFSFISIFHLMLLLLLTANCFGYFCPIRVFLYSSVLLLFTSPVLTISLCVYIFSVSRFVFLLLKFWTFFFSPRFGHWLSRFGFRHFIAQWFSIGTA